MLAFEQLYPLTSTVALTPHEGMLRVRIYVHEERKPKEKAEELSAEKRAEIRAAKNAAKDEFLRQGLLATVRLQPGHGPSYYSRIPKAEGGLPGSQERKEEVLNSLLAEGLLRMQTMPKARGRRTQGVYPVAPAPDLG